MVSRSNTSSILNTLRQIPDADTIRDEHEISLIDHERRAEPVGDRPSAESSDSEAPTGLLSPGRPALAQKLTRQSSQLQQSIKRQLTERKYSKYGKGRYDISEEEAPHEDPASQPQIGEAATPVQSSYLERGRAKAKSYLLKRKRTLGTGKDHQDHVVDILYENQRGLFLFGIPKYSSSSLLPSDPRPWQNAQFRTSPVDIRNAQVPDPSWEWAWKSWYVDMSRDVDEEGWEYSLQFKGGTAWHGNHPWFHSFVRRRRWLRMRRRKDAHHHTTEKAHELTGDYFTIHPVTLRPASEDLSRVASSDMMRLKEQAEEPEMDVQKMEITDIGSLIQVLKKAPVDREKLVAVRKFVDSSGDELYYLADRMPEIMSLFIYQSSRRQLLTDLLQRSDAAKTRRESLKEHDHDEDTQQAEHERATRNAQNILNAVKAADEQVKKLEYWSDIKSVSNGGNNSHEARDQHPEQTFKSKQDASEGVQELHAHPEHPPDEKSNGEVSTTRDKGKGKATTAPSTKDSSAEDGLERYSTAAESVSTSGKKRGGLSTLDGVSEDGPTAGKSKTAAGVSFIDPVPEEENYTTNHRGA